MKRYRIVTMDFDSRAFILSEQIKPDWEKGVKENWIENKRKVASGLIAEFGEVAYPAKINNFIELGKKPFSVVAFHNKFYQQARDAFVIGSYYPALTGICALGERILNHLILKLRTYFQSTAEYKKVYNKDSFDDWDKAIGVLSNWKILRPDPKLRFLELKRIRHDNIHFGYSTDYNDRQYAIEALLKMTEIIKGQFGAAGPLPWFIPNAKGVTYIKKEYENDPYVKEIYLPSCALVGPNHRMEFNNDQLKVVDEEEYEDRDVSDAEFIALAQKSGQC